MSAENWKTVDADEEILSDDEDYYSCLSDMAPFASNECLYGGGFGLDDRSYGRDEVDARFERPGVQSRGITIIPVRNNFSEEHDKILDDIRYLFGDSSDMGSLDDIRTSTDFQYEGDTVIDWSTLPDVQEVSAFPVASSSRRPSDEAICNWKCEYFLMRLDHSDSEDETTEGFNEIFPKAETYPRHEGVKDWEKLDGTPGSAEARVEEEVLQTKELVTSETVIEAPPEPSKGSPECPTETPLRSPRSIEGERVMLQPESEVLLRHTGKSPPSDLDSGLSDVSGLEKKTAENAMDGSEPPIDDLRNDADEAEPEVKATKKIPEVKKKTWLRRFRSFCRPSCCTKRKAKNKEDDTADADESLMNSAEKSVNDTKGKHYV